MSAASVRGFVLGGVIAFAALWPAHAVAPVAAAGKARHSCAAWHSRTVPPPTIRIWVKKGRGTIVKRNFRRYVAEVMAAGAWPGKPFVSARVGALVIAQFAWWETLHRPCDRKLRGKPYDIENGGAHQLWRRKDGLRKPSRAQFAAVDSILGMSIRKHGRFIRTGWNGGGGRCGKIRDGWHVGEDAVRDCARRGKTFEQIIRIYYSPRYELVQPR